MTLEDAAILAQRIETTVPGFTVIAIGRFLPTEELSSAASDVWKVSVSIEGIDRPKVVDSAKALSELIAWSHDQRGEVIPGMLF